MLYAEPWLKILDWRYAPDSGTLRRYDGSGDVVVLEPRLHTLLNFFLQNPQVIVSKEQLLNSVWGDDQGTDAALMRAVATLRKLLADQSKPALFIETHSRKGYCWVANVERLVDEAGSEAEAESGLSVPADAETQLPAIETSAENIDTVNDLLLDVVEKRSRQRFATLRYLCVSVSAVAILCLIFVFLLWRLGREAYIPSFPYQMNISALPGEEIEPLASTDGQSWFYWYRSEGSTEWRLISHESQTHRKIQLADGFTHAGQLHWFGNQLAFTAVNAQGCGIFLQDSQQPKQIQKLASCQFFVSKGIAVGAGELHWLDQALDKTQLWTWQKQQAQLLTTIPGVFRQPSQLLRDAAKFYLLVQEHHLSYRLFAWQPEDPEPSAIANFALAIQNLSWWDADTLLISGAEKLQLFTVAGQRLLALNTHAGFFIDMRRLDDSLLGAVRQNPALDLVPFQANNSGRQAELSVPQWLTSNRDDWLFAGGGAFLSTRSGLPQVWRYVDGHLRQLTQFKTAVTISQLIWQGTELFLVVDQQLLRVDLQTGELSALSWATRSSRRYASCDGQWFWTEQDETGWALYQLEQQQPKRLVSQVVDLRCGPSASLVLQFQHEPNLTLYSLANAEQQQLPIQIDWRQSNVDLWGSNTQAIYWFDPHQQLHQYDFGSQRQTLLALPSSLKPAALYVTAESPLFLLQRRSAETEIVRLQALPTSER